MTAQFRLYIALLSLSGIHEGESLSSKLKLDARGGVLVDPSDMGTPTVRVEAQQGAAAADPQMSPTGVERHLRQPDAWSCSAAVALMITGEDFEAFYRFTGHNGSSWLDCPHRMRRGFSAQEICGYLLSRGYWLGLGPEADTIPGKNLLQGGYRVPSGNPQYVTDFLAHSAVVVVKPQVPGMDGNHWHAVLHTTFGNILDPALNHPSRVEDYDIASWYFINSFRPGALGQEGGIGK